MISHNKLDLVICGNSDRCEHEIVNRTHIVRPTFKTTIEDRKSEMTLALFQLGVLIKHARRGDKIFVYYFSTAFLILVYAKLVGAETITHFISVPIKRIVLGKVLRTLCALLSDKRVFYNFTNQRDAMFIFKMHKKSIFMPIGVNIQEFNSIEVNKVVERKKMNLSEDDFIFLAVGTIHKTRKVEDVVDAFCELSQKHSNIGLVIAGGGSHYESIKSYIQQTGNNKIFLTGIVDHSRIVTLCKISDVGITYYAIEVFNVQPALKTLEYIAAGLPVIAVNTLGNRFYLENNHMGELINDNKESLRIAMEQYLSDNNLVAMQRENITRCDIKRYDFDHIHESFVGQINF